MKLHCKTYKNLISYNKNYHRILLILGQFKSINYVPPDGCYQTYRDSEARTYRSKYDHTHLKAKEISSFRTYQMLLRVS